MPATKTKPTTKPQPTKVGTPAQTVSAETYYPEIHPDKLDSHPANPPTRTDAAEVDELMQSIEQFGQRERVRVRPNPQAIGRYEILSGHRRAQACRRLDRMVRCEVVDIDDNEALREVMLGNAERKDLDAIQRAELLETMIEAGIDKTEAGKLFGLNSASGIKNTLRLLKLPESIRKLIRDGKIPSRAARYLVPYAEAHVILEDLAKSLNDDEWALADFVSSDGEWTPDPTDYRPMDGVTDYQPHWSYKRTVRKFDLYKLSPEQRTALAIVEIPVRGGKSIEVAQNVELFDKLNEPFLEKSSAYGSQRKTTPIKPAEGEKLTPAQLKAEERRKAKEADDRLKKRIPIWIRRFKRCCLATQTPPKHYAIVGTLAYWLSHCSQFDNHAYALTAAETLGVKQTKRAFADCSLANAIATMDDGTADAYVDRLWRILVWPQVTGWKLGPKADAISKDAVITLATELPQKLIAGAEFVDIDEQLDMMLRMADVSLSGGWIDAATEGSPQRLLLRELLEMHTLEQLKKFARSLDVQSVFDGDKKAFVIDTVMNQHKFEMPLRLPDFLIGNPTAGKRSGKGRKS